MNRSSMLHCVSRSVAAMGLAALAVAGLALSPAGRAAADSTPPAGSVPPSQDPFYQAAANIGSYQPGQIIATRPVTDSGISDVSAWQISYRTNDANNLPEMTVTTLLVPQAAWTGGGARPVVSVELFEDSTGLQCSPSYQIASQGDLSASYENYAVSSLLGNNWAVALPDFEGPKSEFMIGPQAGHAVLDGIRAVRNFEADGIGAANPWALDGYSGGANATGWAAQLQPSYAPDIKLAGAAIGGTPADPKAVAQYIDGGIFAGFEVATAESLVTEYPAETDYQAIINAQGRTDLQTASGQCINQLVLDFPFHKLASDTTIADPLDFPPISAVLKADTLGAAAPDTPIYDYHANSDEIVPVGQDNTLTQNWCALGATVQIVRDSLDEHVLELITRQNSVLTFLADRFAGDTATSNC